MEFITKRKVSSRWNIALPVDARAAMKLQKNEFVDIFFENDKIILMKSKIKPPLTI